MARVATGRVPYADKSSHSRAFRWPRAESAEYRLPVATYHPPMGSTQAIVRRASVAGWIIGLAGLLALVALGLFFTIGQPWGTINDLLLIITIGALPVLMLAFWELGGLTPTPLALTAQVLGWAAAATWCGTHLLFVLGVVDIDYDSSAASGAYLVESLALVYIGLWIAGAALLAGPWLTAIRWSGVLLGLGIAVYGIGTIVSGAGGVLTYVGAVAYLLLFPIWGLVMGAFLGRRAAESA
jgi:hypothetical protein